MAPEAAIMEIYFGGFFVRAYRKWQLQSRGMGGESHIGFSCTHWCTFLEQEVREKYRGFCCAAAHVSPLHPATFKREIQIFYPEIYTSE